MKPETASIKRDRAAMEKLRRLQMNNLRSKLATFLPSQASKDNKMPFPSLLDLAFAYVKHLKEKIDELKIEKERLQGLVLPAVVLNEMGSFVEVNLATGLNKSFMLHEVLSILEEEGAVVLNVSYATLSDRILFTVRSQAFSSRIGVETSRVHERLKALTGSGFALLQQ